MNGEGKNGGLSEQRDLTPRQESLVAALDRVLETQNLQIDLKAKELDLRQKEVESNERIAIRSIEAQEKSTAHNREHFNKHLIHRYLFIGGLATLLFVFLGFLLIYGGKDALIEILKIGGSLAIGMFGGYQAGKNKKLEN